MAENAEQKTSALAILPPRDAAWDTIQALRHKHDQQVKVWPPHMNLLYPFLPEKKFGEAAEALAKATKHLKTLKLKFPKKCNFGNTACLEPACAADPGLTKLYEACKEALKGFEGFDLPTKAFSPHLTVGQFKAPRACQGFMSEKHPEVEALEIEVDSICLMARDSMEDPFQVVYRVRFGVGVEAGDAEPYAFFKKMGPAEKVEEKMAEAAVEEALKPAPSPEELKQAALRSVTDAVRSRLTKLGEKQRPAKRQALENMTSKAVRQRVHAFVLSPLALGQALQKKGLQRAPPLSALEVLKKVPMPGGVASPEDHDEDVVRVGRLMQRLPAEMGSEAITFWLVSQAFVSVAVMSGAVVDAVMAKGWVKERGGEDGRLVYALPENAEENEALEKEKELFLPLKAPKFEKKQSLPAKTLAKAKARHEAVVSALAKSG